MSWRHGKCRCCSCNCTQCSGGRGPCALNLTFQNVALCGCINGDHTFSSFPSPPPAGCQAYNLDPSTIYKSYSVALSDSINSTFTVPYIGHTGSGMATCYWRLLGPLKAMITHYKDEDCAGDNCTEEVDVEIEVFKRPAPAFQALQIQARVLSADNLAFRYLFFYWQNDHAGLTGCMGLATAANAFESANCGGALLFGSLRGIGHSGTLDMEAA